MKKQQAMRGEDKEAISCREEQEQLGRDTEMK